MLLELPLDLLIEITLYLNISDKLQLTLTCRKIKETIFERCFYETLQFYSNTKEETESVVLKLRKNPHYGQQVKVLRINLYHLSNQLFGEIPLTFPNVADFYDGTLTYQSRPEESCSRFIKWRDTLRKLDGGRHGVSGILYNLLEKNEFRRLTSLSISRLKTADGSYLDLLECLTNTPSLKALFAKDYEFTLEDIEIIHFKCPLLVTFAMWSCVISVTENKSLCDKITPASLLKKLAIGFTAICDQQCVFLSYLTQKYTCLAEFEFGPSFEESRLLISDQDIELMRSDPGFIAKRNELYLTRESYNVSASSILSNLPNNLKILKIITANIYNSMSIFSKNCVNLTELSFFNSDSDFGITFTSPADIKKFKHLPFLNRLSIVINPSVQDYEETPASISVSKLEVIVGGISSHNDMDVGWILLMFPLLTELTIHHSGTRLVGYESNYPRTYPNLTKLYIGPSSTHSTFLKFILEAAPNLKDLHWYIFGNFIKENLEKKHTNQPIVIPPSKQEMIEGTLCYTIDLDGFALDCFHLSIDLKDRPRDNESDIILEYKRKKVTRRLIISKGFLCVYMADFADSDEIQKINKKLTIQCGLVKNIIINSKITIDLEKARVELHRGYRI